MGNSDHKSLEFNIKFEGKLEKRILSQINRKLLQQNVTEYIDQMNKKFIESNKPDIAIQPQDIYNELSKLM